MPALVGHSRAWTECPAKPGQLIGLGRAFGSSIQIMWRRRTDDKLQFVLRDFAAIDASQVFQGPVVQLILYSFNQFPNETKKNKGSAAMLLILDVHFTCAHCLDALRVAHAVFANASKRTRCFPQSEPPQ